MSAQRSDRMRARDLVSAGVILDVEGFDEFCSTIQVAPQPGLHIYVLIWGGFWVRSRAGPGREGRHRERHPWTAVRSHLEERNVIENGCETSSGTERLHIAYAINWTRRSVGRGRTDAHLTSRRRSCSRHPLPRLGKRIARCALLAHHVGRFYLRAAMPTLRARSEGWSVT